MQNQTYTIKEAAKLCGLPESTLRYYEKMELITGIQRDSTGYRVYSDINLTILSIISCLHATGMSIGNMKEYLEGFIKGGNDNSKQLEALKSQEKVISEEEKELKIRKKYIKGKIKYWELVNEGNTQALEELKVELIDLAKKLKHM